MIYFFIIKLTFWKLKLFEVPNQIEEKQIIQTYLRAWNRLIKEELNFIVKFFLKSVI